MRKRNIPKKELIKEIALENYQMLFQSQSF